MARIGAAISGERGGKCRLVQLVRETHGTLGGEEKTDTNGKAHRHLDMHRRGSNLYLLRSGSDHRVPLQRVRNQPLLILVRPTESCQGAKYSLLLTSV